MEKKPLHRKLTLTRETLCSLTEEELGQAAGGAPTKGVACGLTEASQCATCLCTV